MNSTFGQIFENTETAFIAKSNKELRRANLIFSIVNNPTFAKFSTALVKVGLGLRLPIKGIIRNTVFNHFCGGENIEDSEKTILKLYDYNVKTILDYSVEGAKTEEGFDHTAAEIMRTIDRAKGRAEIPFCVFKPTGVVPAEIFEKVQSGETLSEADQNSFDTANQRIEKICQYAHDNGVRIFIDAEHSWYTDPLDDLANRMMAKFNKERAIVWNTYQLYRTEAFGNMKYAFQKAVEGNYYLGAKLVRGAYMERERERALEKGYEDPIQPDKDATDQAFNDALKYCINEKQRISVCCGSHNEYSNYYLTVLMEKHSLQKSDERVFFSQLYGMSDNISFNLANMDYNVVKYVPYGPISAVMPYLFRRAQENTSVEGQSSRELVMVRKELKRRKNSSS